MTMPLQHPEKKDCPGIDIDIEELMTPETLENIHSQIIYWEEILLINRNHHQKILFSTIIFSIKESFFKATYPLIKNYFHFYAITVLPIDLLTGEILLRLNEALHSSLSVGTIYSGHFQKLDDRKVVTLFFLECTIP